MRLIRVTQSACDRARESLSLALDGELSELEQTRLNLHLAHCDDCRSFEEEAGAMTQLLRGAAQQTMSVPIVLPKRRRLSTARMMQAGAAAAAVALVAGFSAMQSVGQRDSSSVGPQIKLSKTASLGHDDELAPIRHALPPVDFRTAL